MHWSTTYSIKVTWHKTIQMASSCCFSDYSSFIFFSSVTSSGAFGYSNEERSKPTRKYRVAIASRWSEPRTKLQVNSFLPATCFFSISSSVCCSFRSDSGHRPSSWRKHFCYKNKNLLLISTGWICSVFLSCSTLAFLEENSSAFRIFRNSSLDMLW